MKQNIKRELDYYNLSIVEYNEAWNFQKELFELRKQNKINDSLLLLEHPNTYTLGKVTDKSNLISNDEYLNKNNISVYEIDRGGDITYHGPGQIVGYQILNLEEWSKDTHKYLRSLEDVIILTCNDYSLQAGRIDGLTGVWIDDRKIAAIGIKVSKWITMHGFAFNINTDLSLFKGIIPCGIIDKDVTSLERELNRKIDISEVKERIKENFKNVFNYQIINICKTQLKNKTENKELYIYNHNRFNTIFNFYIFINNTRKDFVLINQHQRAYKENAEKNITNNLKRPDWLKVRLPSGKNYKDVLELMRKSKLHTVCEEAKCPNMGECWESRTATFMILGDTCTRSCGFCNVKVGLPNELDLEEPKRVAEAVEELKLKHVVITSVNRDELNDGGASIFAETVRCIRERNDSCSIEILIPDFKGSIEAFEIIMKNPPDILNHNLETVKRLYHAVRPQAKYQRSLELLKWFKQKGLRTKSGIMVGIGEEPEEVLELMKDLVEYGCDFITIGQYLQPTKQHLPVIRYVELEEFQMYKEKGLEYGFKAVESSPLVRSSYHAAKLTGEL